MSEGLDKDPSAPEPDREEALEEARALRREAAALRDEVRHLQGLLDDAERLADIVLRSRRWRLGCAVGDLSNRIRPAPPGPKPWDELREVFDRARARQDRFSEGHDLHPSACVSPGRWTGAAVSRVLDAARADLPHVTVAVCVKDAPDALERCLAALGRWTHPETRVLLVDDGSDEARTRAILEAFARRVGTTLVRHERSLGYVRSANEALARTDGDVVLLNSDTRVGPRWLERLFVAAYRGPDVASVTAVSDDAGAFSVPDAPGRTPPPAALSDEAVARLLAGVSRGAMVDTPTAHGFCVYLRRDAIERVGLFDADTYGEGYGEENDWSLRAAEAGLQHVIDPGTFVFHARSASFGRERAERRKDAARRALEARWPDYPERVRALLASEAWRIARWRARLAFSAARRGERDGRPRLLTIVHDGGGGTRRATLELLAAIEARYEGFALLGDRTSLRLVRLAGGEIEPVRRFRLERPWTASDLRREDLRRIYASILHDLAIEVVHVRHLLGHTLDVADVAGALRIPVVVSFHDYYLACPSTHLLDERGAFCGGRCTAGTGQCQLPAPWVVGLPVLKQGYLETWREEVAGRLLARSDALVVTTQAAADVLARAYGERLPSRVEVIEHGRDLEQRALAAPPARGGPVRILLAGHLDVHKGTAFIRALMRADRSGSRRLALIAAGGASDAARRDLDGLVTWLGPYADGDLPRLASRERVAFVGIFSPSGETYCHVLTEAWALGIPALAADRGALAERVGARGGGVLIDVDDVDGAYRAILAAADDPDRYASLVREANIEGLPSVAEMAARYERIFERCLGRAARDDGNA